MGKAPAARTALISAGVKSPSGPTQTQTEFGGRFRSERTESKCSRGCRASFWRDAIKVSSNFSPRARNAWGATGASICGSQAQPHCLRASTAVVCHFSSLFEAASDATWATVRAERIGTIRRAPSSVAFCTINSIAFPLETACASVTGQGGGGLLVFCSTFSATVRRSAVRTSHNNSSPAPLRTTTRSSGRIRKTLRA